MRVLQVITPSKIAGAERSTLSLCEHLGRAGHEVVIACKPYPPLLQELHALGLDARPLAISGKLNLAAPFRLARLARRERVEVINTQLSTAALWGSLTGRLTGIPTVATVRALNTKTVYTLADRVIAVSHAVKAHLIAQGMPGDRIDVVYNGIDPARYRLTMSREAAREQLGIERDTVLFAVLAHLSVKKGHAVFLQAAQIVSRALPCHYLLVGDGPERHGLAQQAKQLGLANCVRFTGFLADVLPVYAAADVVVLPSIAGEGLPRALLEAGLLGRAVIGTRLSGTPEIIDDGITGMIVPPGDAMALAEAMLDLGCEPELRERLGAAGAERVRGRFTILAMVEGTLEVYRRAQQRSGKG